MKQIVEEAARTHWSESTYNKDAELAYDERDCIVIKALVKSVALRAFKTGADWQAKQSPWISVEERLPEKDGYYLVTDGENVGTVYFFKEWNKFAVYEKYPHPFYKDGVIKLYMPIPSFDQILEANKDVLQRIKEKGTL